MSVVPGGVVSHYRILERLGSGGMGVVYLAYMAPEQARGEPVDVRTDRRRSSAAWRCRIGIPG